MNKYNKHWTREKHIEYRKLKRNGYDQNMLIEHFGEDIYYSGMYNKNTSIMPWLEFITEISINPEYTDYSVLEEYSDIYPGKNDYIIIFEDNQIEYVICLFYYVLENIETYNILLTTKKQWEEYKAKINKIRHKGYITDEERNELVNIVEKETGFNKLYSIMRKVSYILFDMIKNKLGDTIISLGETRNLVKINLYRNIIKNSFKNVVELKDMFDIVGNKYFIYQIKI